MIHMLLLTLRIYKNVINKYHYKLIKILHENLVHKPREGGRCVGETEKHNQELEVVVVGAKCCLIHLAWLLFHLL